MKNFIIFVNYWEDYFKNFHLVGIPNNTEGKVERYKLLPDINRIVAAKRVNPMKCVSIIFVLHG